MRTEICGAPALSRILVGLRAKALAGPDVPLRCSPFGRTLFPKPPVDIRRQDAYVSKRCLHAASWPRLEQPSRPNLSASQWTHSSRRQVAPGSVQKMDLTSPSRRSYSTDPASGKFGEMTEEEYGDSEHRFKPISYRHIGKIFGPGMTAKQGNHLLDTLQKQRVTGTLDHNIEGAGLTKVRIGKGLAWLREHYPLDEDAAIMARIEREEEELSRWQPNQRADSGDVYGESELDKRIKQVKAEDEAYEKAQQAKRNKEMRNEANTGSKDLANKGDTAVATPSAVQKWIEKHHEKGRLSDMEEVPNVTATQVLGPTALFMAFVVGGCIVFALQYTPPLSKARLFPDTPPAIATVGGIIALNVAVWVLWHFPPLWRSLNRYFMLVAATPNPLSMVGSVFSHQTITHLGGNMLGLWFIGTQLADDIGRGRFLAIYLAAGVIGTWLSLVRFVAMRQLQCVSLGASGAVLGVFATYCALYPNRYITIAFLPEEGLKVIKFKTEYVLYTMLAVELVAILRGKIGRIDHAAHLGGMVTGIAAAEGIRRQVRARRRKLDQSMPVIGFGR